MTIDPNILLSLTGVHPAVRVSFDTLYTNLQQEVAAGNVYKNLDPSGELELYSYSPQCQFEGNWTVYSLISRGLILSPKEKKIVCLPYPKFFNYGEQTFDLPNEGFTILEKTDGSLGLVYYYNGLWHVATRGSFQSEQSLWGNKYLYTLNTTALDPDFTYLVEIIYKENRIVIKYDYEGMVLHGCYDNNKGYELSQEYLNTVASQVGFRRPKVYNYASIDELLEVSDSLSSQEEGFVVRFNNSYRIKIKGKEYVRIHRLISLCTPITLWDSMLNGDNIPELKKQLPEEFYQDIDNIVSILNKKIQDIFDLFNNANTEYKNLSDKELGILSQNKDKKYPIYIYNLIFTNRKKDIFTEFDTLNSKVRKKIFEVIRPTGNVITGYTPTSAMNRFSQEDN